MAKTPVNTKPAKSISPHWWTLAEVIERKRIDRPEVYAKWSYGLGGGASDNWDEVYVACDLLNLVDGNPTGHSAQELAGFLRTKIANRRFMQGEFMSWIYTDLHVEPTIIQWCCARELARHNPGTWQAISDGLREWLRAFVGWCTWFGCWEAGQAWSPQVEKDGPGARLLTGKGGPSPRLGGAFFVACPGKRSWEYDVDHWHHNLFAPAFFARLGLGERRGGDVGKLKLWSAIEQRFGSLEVLSADERGKVAAAIRNDRGALDWARLTLIRDWLPSDPVIAIRTTEGVLGGIEAAGKAPTPTVYACGWRASDRVTWAAGSDEGLRGGSAEFVDPGEARFDLVSRTGYCQNTAGASRPRIGFELPGGPLVAVARVQFGSGFSVTYYDANGVPTGGHTPPAWPAPPAPPAPPPTAPPTTPGPAIPPMPTKADGPGWFKAKKAWIAKYGRP